MRRNITRINVPNNISSNLNLAKSTIDLGDHFSDLLSYNNKLYLSLVDSNRVVSFP